MSDNDKDALIRKLHADGLSFSQIAAEVGGMTRNAVIGRGQRMKPPLPARRSTKIGLTRVHKKTAGIGLATHIIRRVKIIAAYVPPPSEPSPSTFVCSTEQLTEAVCKWPLGTPGTEGFGYCGGKKEPDAPPRFPYCAYHARIAYPPRTENTQRREQRSYARMV